jgi:hypothetical protein
VSGKLYASVSSSDPVAPNSIVAINPVAGTVASQIAAGSNPNLLSISSDGSYLWAGMDGNNSVRRFLLPGLTADISLPVPLDWAGNPQEAVALESAPVSPHALAMIAGHWGWSPTGDGVYVYDDAVQRATHVPGFAGGGPMIDWMQWGINDSVIYGNQYTTIDAGGIATMPVTSGGVSLASYGGGLQIEPTITQFDSSNGLLYSYGGAYDPTKPTLDGIFDLPETGGEACTSDSALNRYYCVTTYSVGGTDVTAFELWVFNLTNYALVDRIYFGTTSEGGSSSAVSGSPAYLVRWGNAGLALTTATEPYYGNGGIFLIDGSAVNPNVAPDTTSGTANGSYAWLSSMSPQSATAASGEVQVTITGYGFSPDSTACWNCSFLQFRFLPTTYISPTQLSVTLPAADLPTSVPMEVSVFDQSSNLFSSNALIFTVFPSTTTTTEVTPLNVCGLSMAWDQNTELLYVGAADYDGAYPNSVVAINPASGTIMAAQAVEPDPAFLSVGANGEYLYVAYANATNLTQLALPGLNKTATGVLSNPPGETWLPGDMKAAPISPHTVAVTLIQPGWHPEALGGVIILDDGVARPDSLPGWTGGQTVAALYDTLAWSASDQLLTSAPSSWDDGMTGPLYQLRVGSPGVTYLGQSSSEFNTAGGYLHSDFGTGLIYSDGGSVADPNTAAIVGNYGASGLMAPDSTLNRVFILGQTAAQANTNNYTVQSFDEKAFTPVSSITLSNLSGSPIALVRWGSSGLAVLTTGGLVDVFANGNGMLYLVQDTTFVSSAQVRPSPRDADVERVQQRWKGLTAREALAQAHQAARR